MKKYLHLFSTLLLVVFLTNNLKTQVATIDRLVIIPSDPGAKDTLSVIGYTTFSSAGCKLKSHTVSRNGNMINIYADHTVGILTMICPSADTIPIGRLNSGSYSIIYCLAANSVIRDIDTIHFEVRQFTGAEHAVASEKEMEIYPNPSSGFITVSNGGSMPHETTVSFFSLGGQQLMRSGLQNREQIEMNVSNFPKGVYIIKIQTKTGSLVKKLVIQ